MRIAKTISASLLVFLPLLLSAESIYFKHPNNYYSFVASAEWEEIPKSLIDKKNNEIINQNDLGFTGFTVGFQFKHREPSLFEEFSGRSETFYFQYPYFLVNEFEFENVPIAKIFELFTGLSHKHEKFQKYFEYEDMLLEVELKYKHAIVDHSRNAILLRNEIPIRVESEPDFDDSIYNLMVLFPGNEMITQFNFYIQKSEFATFFKHVYNVIDSFSYEPLFEYTGDKAKRSDFSELFGRVLEKAIAGMFIGLLIGLFVFLISKSKKEHK